MLLTIKSSVMMRLDLDVVYGTEYWHGQSTGLNDLLIIENTPNKFQIGSNLMLNLTT